LTSTVDRNGAANRSYTDLELVRMWCRELKARNLSQRTIGQRRWQLISLATHTDLGYATADDVTAWLDTRRLTPRSWSGYLANVAAFYRWACKRGWVINDPTLMIDRPRLPRLLPRPIADADLAVAFDQVGDDDRMRLWLCLAATEGLRCMEIAGLWVDNVLLEADPPMLRILGKGTKERLIPISADTEGALRRYGIPRTGPLFPGRYHGRPLTPRTVSVYIATYLRSVGVDRTAHTLRHWFGTEIYRRTRDLRATQELMGHASPATTAGYTKFSPSVETVDAVRQLSVRTPLRPSSTSTLYPPKRTQ
jgi:site-specific recombinase XerD